jgi:hypothetical protein
MHDTPSLKLNPFPKEWSGEEENIKLRDQLLKAYPLTAPKPKYVAKTGHGRPGWSTRNDFGEDVSWMVVREVEELVNTRTIVADALTEEHAKVFADAMNAKAVA